MCPDYELVDCCETCRMGCPNACERACMDNNPMYQVLKDVKPISLAELTQMEPTKFRYKKE